MKKNLKGIKFKSIEENQFLIPFGKKVEIPLLEVFYCKSAKALSVSIRMYSSYDENSHLIEGNYILDDHIIVEKEDLNYLIKFIQKYIGKEIFIVTCEFNEFFKFIENNL